MPLSDLQNLYAALQLGLWGYTKDYTLAHNQYLSLYNLSELQAIMIAGKKHKSKPPLRFHEMFPPIDDAASLGRGDQRRRIISEHQKAKNAVKALVGTGAPAWLVQAAK